MMKNFDKLTRRNFKLFAAKHYDNPECLDIEEFNQDLSRFKYLKRLLRRYELTGDLQERLILNHMIVIFNSFGNEAALNILDLKLDDKHWPVIKSFLIYLKYIRYDQYTEIVMDPTVVETLRKI